MATTTASTPEDRTLAGMLACDQNDYTVCQRVTAENLLHVQLNGDYIQQDNTAVSLDVNDEDTKGFNTHIDYQDILWSKLITNWERLGKALKWETEAGVKELIVAIQACTSVQFLNLEGNTLGVEAAQGISKALEKHPELKEALWNDLLPVA